MKNDRWKLSRRQMLKSSLVAGSALVVGFQLPGCSGDVEVRQQVHPDGIYTPNAWVMLDKDDVTTIMVHHSEMGQGIMTALPMILAEEMDADWSKVKGVHAPVADVFKNPDFKVQSTGGSTSVRTSWDTLRQAGATIRTLFINAAAREWGISPDQCRADSGRVLMKSGEKAARYSELIDTAVKLPYPEQVSLKDPSTFKLIGREMPRLDTPGKLNGSAIFGIDVSLPGMLNATIVHPPAVRAEVLSVDDSETVKMPGVTQVLTVSSGVVVVAETYWQALQGMAKLKIDWSPGNTETADSSYLSRHWKELAQEDGKEVYALGDVENVQADDGRVVEADYELPFQAHAPQEPMNCTADVREDSCEVWAPTQNQGASHGLAALVTGLSRDKVKVHTTFLGGGFGRRGDVDYVVEAVEISKAVKKPVKLTWTREEDITADFYRPASLNRMRAVLGEDGKPKAWSHRIVGADHFVNIIPRWVPALVPGWFPEFMAKGSASIARGLMGFFAAGKGLIGGAGPLPYGIPNVKVDFVDGDVGIPVGFWRSVANSSNGFVVESFIDELAYAAGTDPYVYRHDLLQGQPRLRNVLAVAAEKSGWGKPAANGASRGITAHIFHDTPVSMVAEVTVSPAGDVKVHRIVVAVDCGRVINPKIIRAQMESGIAFGLTATLKSAITYTRGRPDQQNFDRFEILRMDEMPVVETEIVETEFAPTGIGEVPVPVIGPAVTNAVFAATGKRIRRIPFSSEDLA